MSEISSQPKPKPDFQFSPSLERELCRIERFLCFGTELNVCHFDRNSSFNAFLRLDTDLKRIPKNTSLKCVQNLWHSVNRYDTSVQKSVANRIAHLIDSCLSAGTRPPPHSLPIVMASLFVCQTQDSRAKQSPFRALAISLFGKAYVRPTDVLSFVACVGRKRLDSCAKIRETLRQYYCREFTRKQMEEILVFGTKFDWSHRDVIILCHVRPNPLTERLLRPKRKKTTEASNDSMSDTNEANVEIISKRIAVMRSKESKAPELLAALDESLLDPNDWLRALNSVHRNPYVWLKLIASVSDDKLLAIIPRVVSKYPNNKTLFDAIVDRLKRKDSHFSSQIIKNFVSFYCEKNLLKINANHMQRLTTALTRLELDKQLSAPVLLVVDKQMDTSRKYLSGLKEKKRRKEDLLDAMTATDFLSVLLKSFNCFVSSDQSIQTLSAIDSQSTTRFDSLEFPFAQLAKEWKQRVIYVTDEQQDVSQWSDTETDERLLVLHLNKRELKNQGFYRSNVLILNGFDVCLEQIIAKFFSGGQNEVKMDMN